MRNYVRNLVLSLTLVMSCRKPSPTDIRYNGILEDPNWLSPRLGKPDGTYPVLVTIFWYSLTSQSVIFVLRLNILHPCHCFCINTWNKTWIFVPYIIASRLTHFNIWTKSNIYSVHLLPVDLYILTLA